MEDTTIEDKEIMYLAIFGNAIIKAFFVFIGITLYVDNHHINLYNGFLFFFVICAVFWTLGDDLRKNKAKPTKQSVYPTEIKEPITQEQFNEAKEQLIMNELVTQALHIENEDNRDIVTQIDIIENMLDNMQHKLGLQTYVKHISYWCDVKNKVVNSKELYMHNKDNEIKIN